MATKERRIPRIYEGDCESCGQKAATVQIELWPEDDHVNPSERYELCRRCVNKALGRLSIPR